MPAAFRLYSKLDTLLSQAGALVPNGYLKFYAAGTTTPKNVYGEQALTTNNGSTINLDIGSGPVSDIWGSGSYFVELYDVGNVKQGEADNVQIPGGEATALPALLTGKYLTNDGAVMSWGSIRQVPDPTGHAGKKLGTDGTIMVWEAAGGSVPATGVAATPTGLRVGTMLLQVGSGSFPASGTQATNGSFTFGTPFNATPLAVLIQMDGASMYLHARVDSKSSTGFTASADSNLVGELILAAQAFKYLAIGPVT